MTEFPLLWVMHRQSEKMHWTGGCVFLVLVFLIASHTARALSVDTDRNRTENGTVTDSGFVPVVFTKVSQIIAREGSCALIDCNVTGDPLPSIKWFNSHGDCLDTETSGKTHSTVTLSLISCLFVCLFVFLQRYQSCHYNFINSEHSVCGLNKKEHLPSTKIKSKSPPGFN